MAEYLTENAEFICSAGGMIKCREAGNNKVRFSGSKLLTTSAILASCKGICAIKTAAAQGTPQTCQCMLTAWSGGFSPGKIATGVPLLTNTATNICSIGGVVRPVLSGVLGKVANGSSASAMAMPAATVLKDDAQKTGGSPAKHHTGGEAKEKFVKDSSCVTIKQEVIEDSQQASAGAADMQVADLLCPYHDCEKCRDCAYPRTGIKVDNDGGKLFQNYKAWSENQLEHQDATDRHYYKMWAEYGDSMWSYQSHHVICGNQVFAKYSRVVKLALFCGYDINNALNCIRLVSSSNDYGQCPGGKSASAYDAMSLAKIQWHLGGHSYNFSQKEIDLIRKRVKLYTKHEADELYKDKGAISRGGIKTYQDLLEVEMQKLESSLSRKIVCRNTAMQKNAFIKRMNNISKKIKDKLGAFCEKPHHSFPYYVSKIAFLYAFALPRTGKIALLRSDNNQLIIEKFRVERFEDTMTAEDGKKITFKQIQENNGSNPQAFALGEQAEKSNCITFCENIKYFVLTQDVCTEEIAFLTQPVSSYVYHIQEKCTDSFRFLQEHQTEILVWLQENMDDYVYEAPIKVIRDRRKSLLNGGV